MLICQHRVNTVKFLNEVPRELGVEIDLRSTPDGRIYLAHDAFETGELLDDWLASYQHAFIVANVKEEGLEQVLKAKFDAAGVSKWAFLDQSFPFMVRELRAGNTQTMVRVSEFESTITALNLNPKPDWVWVDSFTGVYPTAETLQKLSGAGFKLMLVSPELQGREPEEEIRGLKRLFESTELEIDGVCTKVPALWL